MSLPTPKELLISPRGQGKEISVVEHLAQDWAILKRAAREGFYYPRLAIKQLEALSTGLNGKTNVFIPNINDFKANSFQKVVVLVPGIKATVERRSDDKLKVTYLELSDEYKSIEKGSSTKPGVYSVRREGSQLSLTFKSNGRITPENRREVVISDTRFDSPNDAASFAAKKLEDLFGDSAALQCDFDLFYSPVGSRLGGMRNYNPSILNKGFAFSGLLANAIEKSKNQKNVVWASEGSGSVVLTQALQALSHKGISLKEQSHIVKMSMPTTNPLPTLVAAKKLGMIADKNIAKGNGNIRASISCLLTNKARAQDKSDPYSWRDYAADLSNGTMKANTAVGVIAFTGAAATGISALGIVGTVTGSVAAMQYA